MLEKKMNIISAEAFNSFDAICFTSNGIVKKDGRLVMGAGVAKAFRDHFKDLDLAAGNAVKAYGNCCARIHYFMFSDLKPVI